MSNNDKSKKSGKLALVSIRGIEVIIYDYIQHEDHIVAKVLKWIDKGRDSQLREFEGKEIVIRNDATDYYIFL